MRHIFDAHLTRSNWYLRTTLMRHIFDSQHLIFENDCDEAYIWRTFDSQHLIFENYLDEACIWCDTHLNGKIWFDIWHQHITNHDDKLDIWDTFHWQDFIWYLAQKYCRGTCLTHRLRQLSASSKVTFPIIKSCVPSIWCLLEIRHDTKLSCQRRALFWEQI